MTLLRTPDDCFANLSGYPFSPRYLRIPAEAVASGPKEVGAAALRMHYLDAGSGSPVLLLHGEPTWSYLYRDFIPPLVARGYRCIAPDHLGFGKSDKVVEDGWYTYERHVLALKELVHALDLQGVTLVVHDWGGPIGLRLLCEEAWRFRKVVVLNTWLHRAGYVYSDGIARWRSFATSFEPGSGDIPCGAIVSRTLSQVDDERRAAAVAAYDAPFPDASFKAGPRRFPQMLPFADPAGGGAAQQAATFAALAKLNIPVQFIFGDRDVVFPPSQAADWAAELRDATVETVRGGHFPQEESASLIVSYILRDVRG
ncbi:MAG: alpha/beta fold hydrolase [Dehalococcoidia bacterium]